jgi:uncharacterized membrane protein YtjA (UPF0391 family)
VRRRGDLGLSRYFTNEGDIIMLRWAIIFAILALIAGVFGFGNLAGDFSYIARVLLFVFLVLFVVSLIFGRGGRVVA